MTIRLLVTDETPSKLVLKSNPTYNQERDKTYASTRKNGIGCIGIFVLAFALMFLYYSTTESHPWYFWVVVGIVLIAFVFFAFLQVNFFNTNRNFAHDITVTIDLNAGQGLRVEKLESGKTKQSEIKLEEVSRILIACQAVGHSCKLVLELQGSEPFEVNSAYDFDVEAMKEIGKKLGGLLNKPVSVRWSEGSKIDSEEEI